MRRFGFKDYLAQAGGFTDKARRGKTYIIYANGSVDRTKKLLIFGNKYPKLQPGAEIIVPAKPDKAIIVCSSLDCNKYKCRDIGFGYTTTYKKLK